MCMLIPSCWLNNGLHETYCGKPRGHHHNQFYFFVTITYDENVKILSLNSIFVKVLFTFSDIVFHYTIMIQNNRPTITLIDELTLTFLSATSAALHKIGCHLFRIKYPQPAINTSNVPATIKRSIIGYPARYMTGVSVQRVIDLRLSCLPIKSAIGGEQW